MKAPDILTRGAELVGGDRAQQYGDAAVMFRRIADLWTAYLGGQEITARDAAMMLALMKVARTQGGQHTADSFVDGAAYIALAGQLAEAEQ